MQIFSTTFPNDTRLAAMIIHFRKWNSELLKDLDTFVKKAKEDACSTSTKLPIAAVGDGVTLFIKPNNYYPTPSGSGSVAKLFASEAIDCAEKIYERFELEDIVGLFKNANEKIKEFNARHGRDEKTVDKWYTDYYQCAAAFALIKEKKLYWGTMVDSRVAVLDREGRCRFISDDGWAFYNSNLPKNWGEMSEEEKARYKRTKRNFVEPDGSLRGYGVLSGEEGAMAYLLRGTLDIEEGDTVLVFSDGFSPYIEQEQFRKLLVGNEKMSQKLVSEYLNDFIKKNEPKDQLYDFLYKYTAEKTLIVMK